MKKGITVAGSILVDKINVIDAFPNAGQLTQIREVSRAAGGCVPNVAIDLKKICPELPVFASGKVGKDDDGDFVKDTLKSDGVNVDGVLLGEKEKTSFTDVMSIAGGERTFFTFAGASANYGFNDINFDETAEMLHLGYFLLLKKIDEGDGLLILKEAKARGIKTSIDLVSENSDRYFSVLPCLEYTDNLIINEVEAGSLAGIEPTDENIRAIAEKLKSLGVKERVVIHMPHKGVCLSKSGYTEVYSYDLPCGFIKGSTGAGDAFCAGTLAGIYKGYDDKTILELASSAAAASLRAADATSGLVCEEELFSLCKNFSRKIKNPR